jgi:hypothetical protein
MQGDCLAMSLYGVALMPLASRMRETIPKALQPWYCDEAGAAGKALPSVAMASNARITPRWTENDQSRHDDRY